MSTTAPAEARLTTWLLIGIPGLIWGASFLFMAEGLESIGPAGVTFVRIAVGFATLSLFRGAWKPVPREDWGSIALLGFFWLAFPFTMFPFAEQRVSSAVTGMLNAATPLFTTLIAAALARQAPARSVQLGLALGMVGAVLMAIPSLGEGAGSAAGIGMILAALVAYGIALNVARPLQLRHGALPVIWRAQMVALVLTAPLGLPDVVRAEWHLWPVLSLLALGALGTGVALVVTAYAAGRIGAARASSTAFLFPPVALGLGVFVRHEQVAPLAVLGGVVCLAGAWWMNQAKGRVTGPSTAAPATAPTR